MDIETKCNTEYFSDAHHILLLPCKSTSGMDRQLAWSRHGWSLCCRNGWGCRPSPATLVPTATQTNSVTTCTYHTQSGKSIYKYHQICYSDRDWDLSILKSQHCPEVNTVISRRLIQGRRFSLSNQSCLRVAFFWPLYFSKQSNHPFHLPKHITLLGESPLRK